jgi:rhodanese-related sulfurtransferase
VAQRIIDSGYTNVVALLGGLEGWSDAGYPTETGS